MNGNGIIEPSLVSSVEGLKANHATGIGLNEKHLAGSNEPRLWLWRATGIKLIIAALMLMSVLVLTDLFLISQSKPTMRIDSVKLSFESTTSADATLTLQGGLRSNSAFHSIEVTACNCELGYNEDGQVDHWSNIGYVLGTATPAADGTDGSSLSFKIQNTNFASLRRLLYATAMDRPLKASMHCTADINAYMYGTVTVPGRFLIDVQVLAPTPEVTNIVTTTSAHWAGNKLYESVSTTEIDRTATPVHNAASRALQSLHDPASPHFSSLNSLLQSLAGVLKMPSLKQEFHLDATVENPFYQIGASHSFSSFVVVIPALTVATTALGDDTNGGRFIVSSTAFELDLMQSTLHLQSDVKLQCSDSYVSGEVPSTIDNCAMPGPAELLRYYEKLPSNRVHLSVDAVSQDFLTKLAGKQHSFQAEISDASSANAHLEQRLSAARARSTNAPVAAGSSLAPVSYASSLSGVTAQGSCVTMDTDGVYTLYMCADESPTSLGFHMHMLDETDIVMDASVHSVWTANGPLEMHSEMQLNVIDGHRMTFNNTISASDRTMKTELTYHEQGESRVKVDAAVHWEWDGSGDTLHRIQLRSRINDHLLTGAEDLLVEADASLAGGKFDVYGHAHQVTAEAHGELSFDNAMKWFLDMPHLRVMSNGNPIVDITLRTHVDEISGVGIQASVQGAGADELGSVNSAVTWHKPFGRSWDTDGHFNVSSVVHTSFLDWDVMSLLDYEHNQYIAIIASNQETVFGSNGAFGYDDMIWSLVVQEAVLYSKGSKVIDSTLSVLVDEAHGMTGAVSVSDGEDEDSTEFATDVQLHWSDPALFPTEMHVDMVSNTTLRGQTVTNMTVGDQYQNSSQPFESFTTALSVDYHHGKYSASFSAHDGIGAELLLLAGRGRYEQSPTAWLLAADEIVMFVKGNKTGSVVAGADFISANQGSLQCYLQVRDELNSLVAVSNNSLAWSKPSHATWEEAGSIRLSSVFEPIWLEVSSNGTTQNVSRRLSMVEVEAEPLCTSATFSLDLSYQNLTELPDLRSCVNLESLNIEGNKLTSLPTILFNLTKLVELNAQNNRLESLNSAINRLDYLESLYLQDNKLTSLPEQIGGLASLLELHLDGNQLTWLPDEIGSIYTLELLSISTNNLYSLPYYLRYCTRLLFLYVNDNPSLNSFPYDYYTLTKLRVINAYHTQINSFPNWVYSLTYLEVLRYNNEPSLRCDNTTTRFDLQYRGYYFFTLPNFEECVNLEYLDLSGNYLDDLPLSIFRLSKLTTLRLYNLRLRSLPAEIEALTALKLLEISQNYISTLPEEIGGLRNLESLYANNNALTSLPYGIGQLVSLKLLEIASNSIRYLPVEIGGLQNLLNMGLDSSYSLITLPKEIGLLTQLQTLRMYYNPSLTSLPLEFGNLTALTSFSAQYCYSLEFLPATFGNLGSLNTLNLQSSALRTLPEGFGRLTNLRTLNVDYNHNLASLSTDFGGLIRLEALHAQQCQLTQLPASFGGCSSLWFLRLHNNRLASLPNSFGQLTSLRELHCNSNYLTQLPASFGDLSSLWYLEMHYNRLTTLPESFGQLTSLVRLFLAGNDLRSLPTTFGNLTALDELTVSNNPSLTSLPASFGQLARLTTLRLQSNNLQSWPSSISHLIRLNYLVMDNNPKLGNLSDSFYDLPALTDLSMTNCGLTNLSPRIGRMTRLRTLFVSENQLTTIPSEIAALTNLWCFDGSNNRFMPFPVALFSLTSLQELSLSYNPLTNLPPEIINLQILQKLHLSSCSLQTIPSELGQLPGLKSLYISLNKLRQLPTGLFFSASLIHLFAHSNQFETLPREIGNLKSLQILYLSSNQLTSLPAEMGNMTSLHFLHIDSNRLTTLPAELIKIPDLYFIDVASNRLQYIPPALLQKPGLFVNYYDNPLWPRWEYPQYPVPQVPQDPQNGFEWEIRRFGRFLYDLFSVSWDAKAQVDYKDNAYTALLSESTVGGKQHILIRGDGDFGKNGASNWYLSARDFELRIDEQLIGSTSGSVQIKSRRAPNIETIDLTLNGRVHDSSWHEVFAVNSTAVLQLSAPANGTCSVYGQADSTLGDVTGLLDYTGRSYAVDASAFDNHQGGGRFKQAFKMPSFIPNLCHQPVLTQPPTSSPTEQPSALPSTEPTVSPSLVPSANPSDSPTEKPSEMPSIVPTKMPTVHPSMSPTIDPSNSPTEQPSEEPTVSPTKMPTMVPTSPTPVPTDAPTNAPNSTPDPTANPTIMPTYEPSREPTLKPTNTPTFSPSNDPTQKPTLRPTEAPVISPTCVPTLLPSADPSAVPSVTPTYRPTNEPTMQPSDAPIATPTQAPSVEPTIKPSSAPSDFPTLKPSSTPSVTPTRAPSNEPTLKPSNAPSLSPTSAPSVVPTCHPTAVPSRVPSVAPSAPTVAPSLRPTAPPSIRISAKPSSALPTVDSNAPLIDSIAPSAQRSSIALVVTFNAAAVLAGSVTCATFPSGFTGVDSNQRILTEASSQSVSYLAGASSVVVDISGLVAMNVYDVYCVVVTINGVSSIFSDTQATKTVVETACCKTLTFSNAPAFVYGALSQYANAQPNQYVFSYSLSAAPRDSVVITPTVRNLDGSAVSDVAVSPVSSTFASNGNNLAGKFVLSAASTLSGSYKITLEPSGVSAAQYGNATVSVSVISSAAPKPAPTLTGAKFADNGGSLIISFSSATNKGLKAAQLFSCSELLMFAGDTTATCSWVNGASLRAVLTNSGVTVGSTVTLKANLIKAECAAGQDCSGYIVAAQQSVTVAAPDTPVVPVVLLTTPTTVSSCDDVIIDASLSTGSGGRVWSSVVWTVSRSDALGAVPVSAVLAALNSRGVNIATPFVLTRTLFTPSRYTLTLTLTNFLGQSSSATAIFSVDENPNLPIVSILGPAERTLSPVDTFNMYATTTQASCAEKASTISYKWTVLENGNAITKTSYSATPTRFSLLPYSLNVGSVYTFLFEATAKATENTAAITGRSSATVKIVSGAVVVAVVGGDNRQVPSEGQLIIDASPSYDENVLSRVTTGLTFAWTCTYATPSRYGESCASLLGVTSTSVLTVDATQLDDRDLYAFQVVAKAADGRSALTVVTVKPQVKGSSTHTSINTLITKINPDNRVNLNGVVRAAYGLDCTWTAAVDGVNVPLNALTSTRETYSRVAVRNNFAYGLLVSGSSFVPGSSVTFRLRANYAGSNDRFPAFSEVNIKVNAPPSGGFVDVSPPTGSALATSFVVSTAGWTDDAEDFPLTYQFQYQTLATQPLLNLQIRSPANKVSANLPAGPSSSGNAIILVCTVYDTSLSAATRSITATVTENVAIDVTQYMNDQLSNFDSLGDVNTVGQLIANVGSTVNKVNCTLSSDSFCGSKNRAACSATPQTCSSCLSGFTGAPGDSNAMCFSSARRKLAAVEVGGSCSADGECLFGMCTAGVCVSPPKLCPSDTADVCSGHGSCKYTTRSGKPLNKVCTESDFECIAQCECTDGYGGRGCGLNPATLQQQDNIRAALCNAVITVGNNSDPSVQLLESLVGYLDTAFDPKEVISTESLSVCQGAMHFVGDLVLRNDDLVKNMDQSKLDQLLKTAAKFAVRRPGVNAQDGKYIHQLISTLNKAILGSMVNGQAPYSYATQNMRTIISKARIGEVTSLAPPQTNEEAFYGGTGAHQARNSYIEVVNTSTSSQFANSEGYMSMVVMLWGDNPFPGAFAVESALLRVENHNFNSNNRAAVESAFESAGRQLAAEDAEQTDYYIVVQLNEEHVFDRSHSISEAVALGLTNFTFPECTNFDGSEYQACSGCKVSTYTDHNVTFACSAATAAASRRLSGASDGSVNQFGAKFATPSAINPPDETDSSSNNNNDNLALTIGLAVGIPCFVLLVLGLLALYYFCVAKKASNIKVVPAHDSSLVDYP